MRARRNVDLSLNAENMQQQQAGGPHHRDENAAAAINEIDSHQQVGEYDGGENMQGGDVMPIIPMNEEENPMDADDDDDDEDAQIVIIGGWLGSG